MTQNYIDDDNSDDLNGGISDLQSVNDSQYRGDQNNQQDSNLDDVSEVGGVLNIQTN